MQTQPQLSSPLSSLRRPRSLEVPSRPRSHKAPSCRSRSCEVPSCRPRFHEE
ncbi:hypothetical protein TIFTF001_011310 [Ficus carica]|uniref:Uncharacterized protein n=1 Tax=Ficus carica TaxID=3494 RepID=A0AA87ZRH4_FICCA|nr:hypothetical protein TIFTF001_011310 [Ficus carica]